VFRDPSAWYHFVFAIDTTQATASDRVKAYVNGVQMTASGYLGLNYPPQNFNTGVNSAAVHTLGIYTDLSSNPFDGYMAEVNFIDGQALDPSYFGQVSPITGVWSPAKYVGSYGTNGFYLKFSDTTSTTTLCYDYSGNGNNWTPNNISLTSGSTYDSMLDSPTNYDNGGNGVGNYAVLNPLNLTSPSTLSAGNLNFDTGVSGGGGVYANWQFPSSEKYYFELSNLSGVGTANGRALCANTLWESNTGNLYIDGNLAANIGTYADGDTLSWATDCAAKTVAIRKNNTLIYTASAGTGLYLEPIFGFRDGSGSNGITGSINFGQRPFAYTPPSGYKALNTQNLPAASIVNGASFMAATLYTGNGATQSIINAVNGVSFQPDLVWIKSRSNISNNALQDSVRGVVNQLSSNLTAAEIVSSGEVTAFNSNGFSVGNDVTGYTTNASGYTYVGWQWKAGGTAVTNNAGSISSQVSANTTAGFSVVTYTGTGANATVGHGLGVAPSMVIVKARANATGWVVGHAYLNGGSSPWNYYLSLESTAAQGSTSLTWNNTAPTSSVFSLGSGSGTNPSSTMVAYCFAAIPGYSAFGSYTGNGSADGPFVYCGFRPRFILIRNVSDSWNWVIFDTSRYTYNAMNNALLPNASDAESSGWSNALDVLSNGFKLRYAYGSLNTNGQTMIYAAFAENPFKYSLAR